MALENNLGGTKSIGDAGSRNRSCTGGATSEWRRNHCIHISEWYGARWSWVDGPSRVWGSGWWRVADVGGGNGRQVGRRGGAAVVGRALLGRGPFCACGTWALRRMAHDPANLGLCVWREHCVLRPDSPGRALCGRFSRSAPSLARRGVALVCPRAGGPWGRLRAARWPVQAGGERCPRFGHDACGLLGSLSAGARAACAGGGPLPAHWAPGRWDRDMHPSMPRSGRAKGKLRGEATVRDAW